jgi:hypothetical protein
MGDHKKTHCLNGHGLKDPNLYYNPEGCRTCRTCALARTRKRYQERHPGSGKAAKAATASKE